MSEKQNIANLPKAYYARHMQPGICKYDDEVVLVDTDALKKMTLTGEGIPVFIHHQDVDLDTVKEKAAGYITESFYNPLDGWAWFKFLAIDDDVHVNIAKGWKVSNAYKASEFGRGGTKNNCPFNREILNGKFIHLAIVPSPRYENADIFNPAEFKAYQEKLQQELQERQNSKPEPKGNPMKLFKNKKEELTIDGNDTVETVHGERPISTLVEFYNAKAKKNSEGEDEQDSDMENTVEVDGETVPMKELVNRYNALKTRCNEAEDKIKENEAEKAKAEEEKQNALDAEKKRKEAEGRNNFEELRNAHNTSKPQMPTISSPAAAQVRAANRYGSNKQS